MAKSISAVWHLSASVSLLVIHTLPEIFIAPIAYEIFLFQFMFPLSLKPLRFPLVCLGSYLIIHRISLLCCFFFHRPCHLCLSTSLPVRPSACHCLPSRCLHNSLIHGCMSVQVDMCFSVRVGVTELTLKGLSAGLCAEENVCVYELLFAIFHE